MEWYHYLAAFFAGAFLANAIPHLVQGLSGNKFPTPFAKPPGKGPSSAPVNTAWGLFNILVGYLLLRAGHASTDNTIVIAMTFAGATAISIPLSSHFQQKGKE